MPKGGGASAVVRNSMNLFIIGAGFTKAVFPEAPLNPDLLAVLDGRPACRELRERYKTSEIEIALTKLDVDILSSTTAPKINGPLQALRHRVEQDLGGYFESYRASPELVAGAEWLKQFIAHCVCTGDVVVNLNYDCVFEGALDCCEKWSPNGGYGSIENGLVSDNAVPRSPVTVLKIHGSTSFRVSGYLDKPDSLLVGFAINEHFFPRSGKYTNFEFGLGKGASYLIAPSYVKVPTLDITFLMIDALKASTEAQNLIIIGCSLRQEDTFLTLLGTNFLRQPSWRERKMILVDPQAKHIAAGITTYWGVKIPLLPIERRVQESVQVLPSMIEAPKSSE